jgi:hypothetical protein
MKYPEDFASAILDLEIDFGPKGGLQRFKTVGDFQTWLNEEQQFWSWISQPPATNHHGPLGNTIPQFIQFYDQCRSQLDQASQRWNQNRPKITQNELVANDESQPENQRASSLQQIDQHAAELKSGLDQLKSHLVSFIQNEIINSSNHLSRMEPNAQFVKELAEINPEEAIYALDQIILEAKQSGEKRRVEHTGRMLASLHLKNIVKKPTPDKKAFEKAIVTWSKELAEFKSRYEAQEQEFAEISERHGVADETWQQRANTLAEEFSEMRLQSERDLKNLKDTYETHMQLHGPLTYWRGKRKEHLVQIKSLRLWAIVTGVFGCAALFVAAWLVLPENHPAATIPWRQIGFFLLTSTFVLWLVKLLVKLLLSHIHLYADAKEREVMISTFMALIRRPESAQNLKREDIAIVLAPIFKPSTTGVIKDDGGPTSLGDFIGKLSGK